MLGKERHPDMNVLGEVLHAAIAVRLIDPEQRVFPDLVRDLLNQKGLKGVVEADDLLRGITDFTCFVEKTLKPKKVWAEHPMVHVWETGQICKGWIDVLVENDAGMIVIDHKITRDDPAAVVRKYAGQLLAYKQAVEVATGKPADCWIHYPISGHLVRLE